MCGAFGIGDSSSGEKSSNILFGGRGIITRTWQSLRSVMNYSADLIQRLLFALRILHEQNQALNGTIRNMQAHHEDYVLTIEMEKQTTQMALSYLRSTAAEAEKIIRKPTEQNQCVQNDLLEARRTLCHAPGHILEKKRNASYKVGVSRCISKPGGN